VKRRRIFGFERGAWNIRRAQHESQCRAKSNVMTTIRICNDVPLPVSLTAPGFDFHADVERLALAGRRQSGSQYPDWGVSPRNVMHV
jgi:hypothetical protein